MIKEAKKGKYVWASLRRGWPHSLSGPWHSTLLSVFLFAFLH